MQFMHRTWGYFVLVLGFVAWRRSRAIGNAQTRFAWNAMLAVMGLQVAVGIMTVIYMAPVGFAILHQIIAVLLWVLLLRARFLTRYPLPQSVRGTVR